MEEVLSSVGSPTGRDPLRPGMQTAFGSEAFEGELGVQAPVGFWDPVACIYHRDPR